MLEQTLPHAQGAGASASTTELAAEEAVPYYQVAEFTFCEEDTDSEFIVLCRGKRLIIRLFEDNFSESPQLKEEYLFFLRVADEGDLEDKTVEDFYDWVMEPFLPILRHLPRRNIDVSAEPTLQDLFSAETSVYTLVVAAGKLSPTKQEATSDDTDWSGLGIILPNEVCFPWPCFRPSDVQICAKNPDQALSELPHKVKLVGGTTPYFLKLTMHGDQHPTKRELAIYKTINESLPDSEVRIPRLHGLVRNDQGVVFELLLSYINCRFKTLTCAVKPDSPAALRSKWKDQVSSTLDILHKAGVIWGDVKTDNVLIDDDDDAWIVDFGGRYTEGWVEKESAETLAGDEEGLANILKYIGD